MKKIRNTLIIMGLLLMGTSAFSDDGVRLTRDMSQQEADLYACPSHGEHAFTRLMNFRVPAQAASGDPLDTIEYEQVDGVINTQITAKPIVSVYVFGPVLGVEGADGFQGHGKRDVYASISLDDGTSWKTTNISDSANDSSFIVTTPIPVPGDYCGDVPLDWNSDGTAPDIHNINIDGALHAYDPFTPEGSGCTDCHSLTPNGASPDPAAPSCQECHVALWGTESITAMGDSDTESLLASLNVAALSASESDNDRGNGGNRGQGGRGGDDDDSDDDSDDGDETIRIDEAEWDDDELEVEGSDAPSRAIVTIINGVTGEEIGTTIANRRGDFDFDEELDEGEVPCTVAAVADGEASAPVEVEDAPEDCVGDPDGEDIPTTADYPGDNNNVFHAVAGNKILIAWQSRFCQAGQPAYALEDTVKAEVASYLGIDIDPTDGSADMYLEDLFVVGGDQGSIDYETEGFPQVGEVPFNCLWTARGVIREDPEALGTAEVVWFKSERLTSGRRDLTRIETQCAVNGGCAITWQEDPVGLRPGEGEGPGTGWAGATTNSKTDIWYSYLPWEHFDIVDVDGTAANALALDMNVYDTKPGAFVPFSVPVRLTNNDRCTFPVDETDVSYCNEAIAGAYGIKNQCVGTVLIPLGPQGNEQEICVVDANDNDVMDYGDLPNLANTAASRPRLNVKPRDADGDGVTDGAWVVVVHEEDKGLGRYGFEKNAEWDGNLDNTATFCSDDPDADLTDTCLKADVGKNTFYLSFAMGTAASSASEEGYGLLDALVYQGAQINRPENNWRTGDLYEPMSTVDMWDFGELNYLIFDTQIARRTSLMSQSVAKAEASTSGLLAMPLYKEGIMNQGGPADIQAVRVVVEDEEIDEASSNPYAPANLACENLWFEPGTADANPYYPNGLCMLSAINLSGMTPYECEASGDLSITECPGVSNMTCDADTEFGQLCLAEDDPEDQQLFPKLLSWYECPGANGSDGSLAPACGVETVSTMLDTNLDDQAWFMPLDVSKAHRGYLDGDFVMMLYAKSPNWKLNTVGNDRYELYLRRSFTGGMDWTTTPGNFLASDGNTYSGTGTTTCETWRAGEGETSVDERHNCTIYGADEDEQSRNMSQLQSMRFTILDPRYAPNISSMVEQDLSAYGEIFTYVPDGADEVFAETDINRPDRFHIVYETGDNTTVAIGEGEPLNLNHGRGFNFGDHFQVWFDEEADSQNDIVLDCYPSNPHGDETIDYDATGFCNEFDTLEGSQTALSEEASMTSSAAGDFLYAVWGQINLEQTTLEEIDGNSEFRRVWWLDGYLPSDAWENLVGGGSTTTP